MSTPDDPAAANQPEPVPPYGGAWGWPAVALPPPQHPKATSALAFGLVSVIGAFVCILPLLLSPVAWIQGRGALKEIDANPQRWGGRDLANAGYVMGIVGTVLLAASILGFIALMALLLATD